MGYQLPTLEELQSLPAMLDKSYKGSNPERKNFIKLANLLIEQQPLMESDEAANILMGAYMFEMETIENSYRMMSAKRSRLYDLLHKNLGITRDNVISKEDKLIYLAAFYRYIQHQAPDELVKETSWVSKVALVRPLLATVKSLLWKQDQQVQCLLASLPTVGRLQENLTNMELRYNAKCPKPGWFFSTNAHAPQAKFIDFINDYCDRFLGKVTDPDIDPALQCHESYLLRISAAVYVMKTIEDEYSVTSPKGTNLYDMCRTAINADSTSKIDLEDKIGWLECLNLHLKNMQEHRKEFLDEKEAGHYKSVKADIMKIRTNITSYVAGYMQDQLAPSRLQGGVTSVTSGVARHGMNAAIRNMAGSVVPSPAGMVIDSAAGMTGFAIFGPGGAFVGSTMSRLVRTHLIPLAFATVFTSVLDKIGQGVGATATNVVFFPFSMTAKGLQSIMDRYGEHIDKSELRKNKEWIEALMSFPDDVLAPDKKAVIENTIGIKAMAFN